MIGEILTLNMSLTTDAGVRKFLYPPYHQEFASFTSNDPRDARFSAEHTHLFNTRLLGPQDLVISFARV